MSDTNTTTAPEAPAGGAQRHGSNRRMAWVMLWSAVFRRRSRAVMAVIASAVGAATFFCLVMVCVAVPQRMSDEMRSYGANLVVTPADATITDSGAASGFTDAQEQAVIAALEAQAPVQAWASYRFETVRIHSASYELAGIDPQNTADLNHHWTLQGGWPTGDREVVVGTDIASGMLLSVGSTLQISNRADTEGGATATPAATDSTGRVSTDIMDEDGVDFRVAGILSTGGDEDGMVFGTKDMVASFTGATRGDDVIAVSADADGDTLTSMAAAVNADTGLEASAQAVTRVSTSSARIMAMLSTLFWIITVVVLALTLIGVATTMMSIVSQRRNEIGLSRALGAPSKSIARQFCAEAAVYGFAGGIIGAALGYVVADQLTTRIFDEATGFSWPLALACVLLSMLVAVLASVSPVRRALAIRPALVLQEE